MKAKEALLVSKLGKKKKLETAKTGPIGGSIPTAQTGPIGGSIGTASTGSSGLGISANTVPMSDVLKSAKLTGGIPAGAPAQVEKKPKLEGDVSLGPTEVKHSPIGDYLKKKKGK